MEFRVGILISSDGPYSMVSRSMLCGALLAVDEFNAENHGCRLEPVIRNPQGEVARYVSFAEEMLALGIKHVVGCYTSQCRKEVIPLFEKADALLWYPQHYEGFESTPNVVYTGAVANQHLIPLLGYLLQHVGSKAFCVGSNYIWAWENNRILRDALIPAGGAVLGERYFPVGSTDFGQAVEAVLAAKPSFVFNTLIGSSSYQFMRDLRAACKARGIDQPATIPIASCTLSEPELSEIGPEAVDGHITSSVYFSSIATPRNARFTESYQARFPDGPGVSCDAEAGYLAIKFLGHALAQCGTTEANAIKRAAAGQPILAPQGEVFIDPETMHTALTPRIARSNARGGFDILMEAPGPVLPDPYLIRNSSKFGGVVIKPPLRVA